MKDIALNAFELYAKVVLNNDDYKKKLDESESKFSKFAGLLKNGLTTATKIGTAAIGAAATAVSALTKASIENYAEYEQLVGGVETLFKKSSDTVMKYAENAYKTAGLSANEYMETVTSFSASLLQSVGGNTEKAAKYADQAITDMADNANKMGSSMESIQNAYQGFAKQNYTMLDNLKLGYGGTKEEMQRLLKDAQKISGQKFDLSSYADVVQAIHVVQTEMGITGTTANEAATTISGSAGMMKASWQNLVTGIADDEADFDSLINNFVSSATTFLDNLMPRVEIALGGVGKLVAGIVPLIVKEIPVLLESVLPGLIEAVTSLVSILTSTLSDNAPMLLDSALVLIESLGGALIENAPMLIDTVLSLITQLAEWLAENAETFAESAIDLIVSLADSLVSSLPDMIPAIIKIITEMVNVLTEPKTLAKLLEAALAIILAIGKGLVDSFPDLVVSLVETIDNVVSFFTDEEQRSKIGDAAWELGEMLIKGIWEGVKNLDSWFSDKISGWFDNTVNDVKADQEIHSPSRLWARLIGKPIGQGVGEGAVEGLEESEKNIFYTFDKMSKKAIEKVEKLADEIKKRLDEIHGYFETTSDIAELEYEMWELTEGLDASEAEKAAKKIELLNKQLADQKQIVDASSAAYEEMIKLYGEGSVEAMEYKKALLEEQVEYQKMQNELNETNKSYKQLAKSQRTWATVAVDAAKLVTSAFKETVQVSDAATTKNEKATSKISDDIKELISLFTSGKAKTAVSNARDLRSVSYG